jgi:hypothetical protein
MKGVRTRQVAFRLPLTLIERISRFEAEIYGRGLNLSRTDVVRLLLTYALDRTDGDVAELLGIARTPKKGAAKRPSKRA